MKVNSETVRYYGFALLLLWFVIGWKILHHFLNWSRLKHKPSVTFRYLVRHLSFPVLGAGYKYLLQDVIGLFEFLH